jgi:hypothetical protein
MFLSSTLQNITGDTKDIMSSLMEILSEKDRDLIDVILEQFTFDH